ncbi:MAG TPA: hypothetical protein VJR27_02260 [Candidatus Saccharimonadales bacterium]|nr:hypothetical protein [Candidatus Saccharimonadales bacterium]
MSSISTHEFLIPAELHNSQAEHAAAAFSSELAQLLDAYEHPDYLLLAYYAADKPPLSNGGNQLQPPPGYPPAFELSKRSSNTYEAEAVLPFSTKVVGVGTCAVAFNVLVPPEGYVGLPIRINKLARHFWMGAGRHQFSNISAKQQEASAAIKGLADSLHELRTGKKIVGGKYAWWCDGSMGEPC